MSINRIAHVIRWEEEEEESHRNQCQVSDGASRRNHEIIKCLRVIFAVAQCAWSRYVQRCFKGETIPKRV